MQEQPTMKLQNNFIRKITKIMPLFLVAVLAFSFTFSSFSNQAFARRRRNRDAEEAELRIKNNNIIFSKFDAKYNFSADQKGNTNLEITENISTYFINDGINHGIERAIPRFFNGKAIFDGKAEIEMDGKKVSYSTYESDGNIVFRIGESGSFVYGRHNYQLKYRFRNLLLTDGGVQKLIMNTNGTQWREFNI